MSDPDTITLRSNPEQRELARLMLLALDLAHKHDWRPAEGPRANEASMQGRMEAAAKVVRWALGEGPL